MYLGEYGGRRGKRLEGIWTDGYELKRKMDVEEHFSFALLMRHESHLPLEDRYPGESCSR